MPYRPLPRLLFRAPLLPASALGSATTQLRRAPISHAALEWASPDLARALRELGGQARATSGTRRGQASAARDDARTRLALDRYARRAALRPTPHGLLAGVGVGTLGARQRIDTGAPRAVWRIGHGTLAGLARSALDITAVRRAVWLRRAPSLCLGAELAVWLGPAIPGEPTSFVEERRADLDPPLRAVLTATEDWVSWTRVRRALARGLGATDSAEPGDAAPKGLARADGGGALGEPDELDQLDELLLVLVDEGLLLSDLAPPLLVDDPATWLARRLGRIPEARNLAGAVEKALARLAAGDPMAASAALGAPMTKDGASRATDIRAALNPTLVFAPPRPPALSSTAIRRAAELAPLLFQVQETLAAPAAERTPEPAMAAALEAATEIFGVGALDLAALTVGDYGVDPASTDAANATADGGRGSGSAAEGLVALLAERIAEAARAGTPSIELDVDDLIPLVANLDPPPTCELFLTPCRDRPRAPAGSGWLLGLHAPAGASWGRFAFALGDDGRELLRQVPAAERTARPGEDALDVLFAPSAALADLTASPPLRAGALALTGWPARPTEQQPAGQRTLTPADLGLVADPGAIEPLGLRAAAGRAVRPSPLGRVRSTTAPAGAWRTLVGWSLFRQHAPWAFAWGPLANLAWLPRVCLGGFVVAPASWRVPDTLATPADLRAWRRRAMLPRWVNVGHEDELLAVDLDGRDALVELRHARAPGGQARVHEIWPLPGDTPDAAGRRIEAVVALANVPSPEESALIETAIAATANAGDVPPPRVAATAARPGPTGGRRAGAGAKDAPPAFDARAWRTFKLFGAAERQDTVLLDGVGAAIAAGRRAGLLDAWFFQRYVEGPGRRPHLRVRVRARGDRDAAAAFASWERQLERFLRRERHAGNVVTLERGDYVPERARYGGPVALDAALALFEAESDLALDWLSGDGLLATAAPNDLDDELALPGDLVLVFDAMAAAFGLDGAAREACARRRRDAHAGDVDTNQAAELSSEFRAVQRPLRAALAKIDAGSLDARLATYARRATAAVSPLDRGSRARLLPITLHLCAVRLCGTDPLAEIRAYTFWQRAREGLTRRPVS